MKLFNLLLLKLKSILSLILFDSKTPMAQAVKYKQIDLPSTEEELNSKIIQPSVYLTVRINLVKSWLNEYKNLYNQEETRKKNFVGYSKESAQSIQMLSLLTKNIDILTKELRFLEKMHGSFTNNYRSYLKLYDIPPLSK